MTPEESSPVLERFPRRREELASRVIAGEAVVVSPADSKVHELNAVATFVWERCDGRRSGRELAREVTRAFDVAAGQAEADVARLLETLAARGLVELREGPVGG